jgi:uncharacterized protein YbjT (DUF2867 family)
MTKAPDVSVLVTNVEQLQKLSLQKLPTRIQLDSSVLSRASDSGVRSKIKDLISQGVKVTPALRGRNNGTYIEPPKQNSGQLSKPITGFRLQDLKARSLTSTLYSTSRPRPLRGLVATVFGTTGFLGLQVAQVLANRGAQVICPIRPNPMGYELRFAKDPRLIRVLGEQGQVFPVKFDPTNFDELTRVVNRSHMVFNCIGTHHKFPNQYDAFGMEGVYCNLPQNIARACTMRGVQRFVHVSHVNANSSSDNDVFRYKGWGETAVLEEFPNAIIVRPTDMFGPDDNFTNYMRSYWGAYELPLLGQYFHLLKGKEYVESQPVWVVDVARGMVRAAMRESCFGETLEFGGTQRYKLVELMRYVEGVSKIHNSKLKIFSLEEAKLRFSNRPTKVHRRTWMDEHLRQDVVVKANAKSWEEVDVDVPDLVKIEDVAPEWLAPHLFYEEKLDSGVLRDDPTSVTLGQPRQRFPFSSLFWAAFAGLAYVL